MAIQKIKSTKYVFFVKDESMTPTIPGESKILCRKIKKDDWKNASGVVAIIYDRKYTVRRVLNNGLSTNGTITLKADNPDYGQTDIKHSEIREMWQAIEVIDKKIE